MLRSTRATILALLAISACAGQDPATVADSGATGGADAGVGANGGFGGVAVGGSGATDANPYQDGPAGCDADLWWGAVLLVIDDVSCQPIAGLEATLIGEQDGGNVFTIVLKPGSVLLGALGEMGCYAVELSAPGYVTRQVEVFAYDSLSCAKITNHVTLLLHAVEGGIGPEAGPNDAAVRAPACSESNDTGKC